jgi:hypothetical protein
MICLEEKVKIAGEPEESFILYISLKANDVPGAY